MEKLRVAIIGCGRIFVMHAVPATVLKETELTACCDISLSRAVKAAAWLSIRLYILLTL